MTEYLVTWEINEEADSPEEAARQALRTQRNPESLAVVFSVQEWPNGKPVTIDLLEES